MTNNKLAKTLHSNLNKKYNKSLYTYAIMSVVGFALSAILIIFNLYAIRFNPASTASIEAKDQIKVQQWLFIAIAILAAIQAFMTGVLTIFTFRKKAKLAKGKVERINIQIDKYKNQLGDYESTNRDAVLIDLVTKIINE